LQVVVVAADLSALVAVVAVIGLALLVNLLAAGQVLNQFWQLQSRAIR
jgi:hypothetical protein